MSALPKTYCGPGLLDLQVNGYAGVDFNADPAAWTVDQLHQVRQALWRRGVVAVLPTIITDDAQAMIARAARLAALTERDEELAGCFPKLHVEGPFLSPADGPRGAHPKQHCRTPSQMPDFLDRLLDACGGRIGIMTLAPELPGAIELIGRLTEAGVCPAIGHTQAGRDPLDQAVRAGAKLSTHLGNGSHQVLPRLDNYVQTQLADDRLAGSFIADGHHMPLTTLKNFIRAKTPALSVLITDAIAAAEMASGTYMLAGRRVTVRPDGYCSIPGQDNLAGSTLTMDRAVINVSRCCDVDFDQAWAMASTQPARLVGMKEPQRVTVEIAESGFTRL